MNLTMKTDMGAFQFDLGQGDIIFLLDYAQKHEIHGEQAVVGQENTIEEKPIQIGAGDPPAEEAMVKDEIGKYKGFLLITCESCGETRGFCSKTPIDSYVCSCGYRTHLESLKPIYMDCDCGRHFKYMTNEEQERLTHTCISCGNEVDFKLNSRKTAYVTIGDPRIASGAGKIRAFGSRW